MGEQGTISHQDEQLLVTLRQHFGRIAGADQRIDAAEFQKALGIKSEYLATRIFSLFDRDGDGRVHLDEFLDRVRGLVFGTPRQKLRFVFRLHDHDGDGRLSRAEIDRIIHLSLAEDRVSVDPAMVRRLVNSFYAAADADRDGGISFEEFERVIGAHPQVMDQITRTEARWICPNEDLLSRLDQGKEPFMQRAATYLQDRGMEAAFVTLWLVANVLLFGFAFERYRAAGAPWMVWIARGCGACLNFNGALILVPMMRRLLTWIRRTWLNNLIPVDESIAFHKLVGHAMWVFGVVHTVMHFINYAQNTKSFTGSLFGTTAGLTGFFLLLVFAIMWLCSLEFVRRSGRFELFYWTHILYVGWFSLCLFHGPVFWMWASVPIAGYLIERILRLGRRASRTEVVGGHPLASGVTHLEIRRPAGWEHRAGDYLFLRIPELASHEWHPFTISSAPEKRATVSVHIRTLGNWTTAVRELFQRREAANDHRPVPCFIDGPYGTPSVRIFECRHAVLVGAGIGVTPFASILQSILYRMHGHGDRPSKLQSVHFIWLNRDQYSFEWFRGLLAALEQQDHEKRLDIQIYMTGGRVDITAAALGVAREIVHEQTGSDLVTGLRAHTHFGRPDWDDVLGKILRQHAPEPVHVFFCGAEGLARVVKGSCRKLGMLFRQEHF
jgi:NADPH oxidase 5